MFNKHQSKFYLASICAFNLGAMALALFNLDWLGWLIISTSGYLWFKGMKHDL